MTPAIRVDEEVFKALQARAQPFVDTPNDVLRRLLGLDATRHGAVLRQRTRPRLPPGSATHNAAFRGPILKALVEVGGSAAASAVLTRLAATMATQLTELDRAPLPSGDIRWRKGAQFERLSMVRDGLLRADSPRGLWELTDRGWKDARQI